MNEQFLHALPAPLRTTLAQVLSDMPSHSSLALENAEWRLSTPQGSHTLPAPVRLHTLLAWLAHKLHAHHTALSQGWAFDARLRLLSHASAPSIALTDKESLLLAALLRSPAHCTRDALTRDIWGHSDATDSHTLETHIYRLRGKLKGICTIQSTQDGYSLASLNPEC